MLGKLFKHEFHATARVFGLMYVIVAGLTTGLVLTSSVTMAIEKNIAGSFLDRLLKILEVSLLIAYIVSLIAVGILTVVYLVYHYYQTMVCDEGYLTHTLPVPTWQLIFVKTAAAVAYTLASTAVLLISILAMVKYAEIASGEDLGLWEILKEAVSEELMLNGQMAPAFYVFLFLLVLYILIVIIYDFLVFFTSIAAGNLFASNKLAGSIGVYILYQVAVQFIGTVVGFLFMWFVAGHEESFVLESGAQVLTAVNWFLFAICVIWGALSAGLFAVSNYILKNKLNLA